MKDRLYLQKGEGFPGEWISIVHRSIIEEWKQDDCINSTYVTDAGYFPNAKGHFRERNEGIMENILIYCLGGEGFIEIGEERITLNADEAYIIPAFMPHKYQAAETTPWSILWMHFAGKECFVNEAKEKQKVNEALKPRIVSLFSLLRDDLRTGTPDGKSVSYLASLIIHEIFFKKNALDANKPPLMFEQIENYMREHLSTELTIKQLSLEFEIPESTLCVLFKKHSGKGPIDFFTSLRMKEAEKLLRESSLYIYQVAELLGYKDQYYFSRVFTKYAGESPREYRKRGI